MGGSEVRSVIGSQELANKLTGTGIRMHCAAVPRGHDHRLNQRFHEYPRGRLPVSPSVYST